MDYALFKLAKVNEGEYRSLDVESASSSSTNGVIIAKAMAVATLHKPQTMNLNSCHIYLYNAVQATTPSSFVIQESQLNEETGVVEVKAIQNGNSVLKAQFCFHKECGESIASQCHMPVTAVPKYCVALSEAVNRLMEEWEEAMSCVSPAMKSYALQIQSNPVNSVFDIRVVDGESFAAATMKGFFTKLWAKGNIDSVTSMDKNKLFATYFVEATLIPSMLRYHMSAGFSPTRIIPVDFCCWFHSNEFTVNDWLLCENHFSIAKNGRAFIEHHLWNANGDLIMTASSEAIVKGEFVAPKNKQK